MCVYTYIPHTHINTHVYIHKVNWSKSKKKERIIKN